MLELLERFAASPAVLDAAVLSARNYVEWQAKHQAGGFKLSSDDDVDLRTYLSHLSADGAVDPRRHTVRYANAGHDSSLLRRASGTIEPLTRHGDVLGVFEGLHFEATTVALGSGDALLLYTDGVTDAWHPGNGDYSIDRLTAALVAGPENAGELLAHLEADLDAFTEGAPQQDGVMILILTRN